MLITFLKRLFSTVLLLSLFGCSIFLPAKPAFIVFSVMAIFLSYFTVIEFTTILKNSGHPNEGRIVSLFVTVTVILTLFEQYNYAFGVAILYAVHCWAMFLTGKNEEKALQKIIYSAGIYILFTIPIFMIVDLYLRGPLIFLYLVLVTKIADIAAYVVGTLSHVITHGHNHKLIPSISPGKSWEGAIGGLIFTAIASCILWRFCFETSVLVPIIAGVILFFGSMAGDLSESAFKRTCQVKDSGVTLPGIGGLFDLVDSLMINSCLFWLFLTFCSQFI